MSTSCVGKSTLFLVVPGGFPSSSYLEAMDAMEKGRGATEKMWLEWDTKWHTKNPRRRKWRANTRRAGGSSGPVVCSSQTPSFTPMMMMMLMMMLMGETVRCTPHYPFSVRLAPSFVGLGLGGFTLHVGISGNRREGITAEREGAQHVWHFLFWFLWFGLGKLLAVSGPGTS